MNTQWWLSNVVDRNEGNNSYSMNINTTENTGGKIKHNFVKIT